MPRSCVCEGRDERCAFCRGFGTLPDEIALAAVRALHNLAVQEKYGINLTDYIPAAREAYSSVALFLQSDNARKNTELCRVLANTVKWHQLADRLYRREVTKMTGGRLSSAALCWDAHCPDSDNAALFNNCPELRTPLEGNDGQDLLTLSYADTPQKAWRLAAEALAKADKYMK